MQLPDNVRQARTLKRRGRVDNFPKLQGWNPELPLLPHQEVGVLWEYLIQKGINADQVGLGKMIQAFGLMALLRQLGEPYRTLVICESNAHKQWLDEGARFVDLEGIPAWGSPAERRYAYQQKWDFCVTSYALLRRDHGLLCSLNPAPNLIVFDESGYFRHHNIQTHQYAKTLTYGTDRVLLLDGTPIQNTLLDIHGQFEVFHNDIFGSSTAFGAKYIDWHEVGEGSYKRLEVKRFKNVRDFQRRLDPYMIRRTPDDAGLQMPDVVTEDYWLDLPPHQREVYERVRRDEMDLFKQGNKAAFRKGYHLFQYACQPVGSLVLTDKGFQAIETIITGDLMPVGGKALSVTSHGIKQAVEIKTTSTAPTVYSYDHMIPVHRNGVKHLLPAERIVPGDFLEIPVLDEVNLSPISFTSLGPRGRVLRQWTVQPNERVADLIAEYIGDGNLCRHASKLSMVAFSFGSRKVDKIEPFMALLNDLGFKPALQKGRGAYVIRVCNSSLAEWLFENFGERAAEKRIPAWVLRAPKSFVEQFLKCYPDGSVGHNGERTWTSGNLGLANSFVLLHARLGNISGLTKHKGGTLYKNSKPFFYSVQPALRQSYVFRRSVPGILLSRVTKVVQAGEVKVLGLKTETRFYNTVVNVHNCDTTAALGETPGHSVKIDWIVKKLKGDLKGRKVIIFAIHKAVLKDVAQRLDQEHISNVSFVGGQVDRNSDLERFKTGNVQVLLGTTAIKRGLNLQMSSHMIAMDELDNPQSTIQLAGRLRRIGSKSATIYLIFLRTNDTFERRRWEKAKHIAALPDTVFDEENEIYDKLSDKELYNYIAA